ncbi:MAG: phosphoglucosamine mutase [Bacteroidetes bacterium]|nr:phosphoglucosamine mutase [Bacteroidota bacterium]
MPLIRSISGLRGTIGDSLGPDIIVRYVAAFAQMVTHSGGTVVVGHDGRPSGGWIEDVVVGTLRSCGVNARTIGMAPTPTVQLATEHSDASGGISISASHNPSEWNGLKFLNHEGIFLDGDECAQLFGLVDAGERTLADWAGGGSRLDAGDEIEKHCERALALPFVRLPELRARRFTVVVDAVNASGSEIVPMMLERCGCQVVRLFCAGSGLFPHTPEPLPENLTALADAVRSSGADIGIAVDPDADRLVLIDERGVPFGEEYTITQAADFVLRFERARDAARNLRAVVNLSTTRAVEDVAARYAAQVLRTPVGEINVARAMKQSGAVIGGEGSGGVILPELHYGRDSIAGIMILLHNLLERGGTMSALRAALPAYEIAKRKAALLPGTAPEEMLARIEKARGGEAVAVRTDDGLKLDYERAWVHLRASNTEPIIRVIAEAHTRDEAARLADDFLGMIEHPS